MSEMIEVIIDSIRVHLMAPQRVIVLKEVGGERFLTIWVGPYEAEAITVALQEVEVARPLTHDLIKNIFGAFKARVLRVEVVRLQGEIFYGNIVAESDGREIHIDARPSDAIAIAVRAHAPILVHRQILEDAGILPEKDMPPAAPKRSAPPLTEDGSDRLSVFKDFIDKLDLDDTDKNKPA
ncbi:MAG: bifunctional nuclease family protein [Anaerolineales bacterium]